MDLTLEAIAETLAKEFADLPRDIMVRALNQCADEYPAADPLFVENATRARLSAIGSREPGDSGQVALDDSDLREEVDLLVHVMVAANTSETPLTQREVDEILDADPD